MSDFPNIRQVLDDGGQRIVDLMVNALQEKGAIFQGELARSITSNVTEKPDGATLSISMLERGEYLDKGVNGTVRTVGTTPFKFTTKGPPPQELKTWVAVKGPTFANGKPINEYAMSKLIKERGIKPRNFIQPSLSEGIKWMEGKFEEAGQEDIEAFITQVGKESKIEVK